MKTNLDQFFKVDDQASKDGVWFEISDTTKFLVKPFSKSNPQIKKVMERHFKPYARQIDMGTLAQSKIDEIQRKIFVEACLLDWKGVEIDGAPVEFSKEKAMELFACLPDLEDTLMRHAEDKSNYREIVGNS